MSPQELEDRLAAIDAEVSAEVKTKKGIATLVDCYEPGSAAKLEVEQQIRDCEAKIETLNNEKVEIEAALGVTSGYADGGMGAYDDYGGDEQPEVHATALYDYEAQGDGELSFAEGDVLRVLLQDDSGWWEAELNGVIGVVPSNYLQA